MKIDNSVTKLRESTLGESRLRPQSAKEASAGGVAAAGANSSSVQLQSSDEVPRSGCVFNAKLVQEITLAMSEGRFKVTPGKIADGLLETVRDLLQTPQR